MKITQEVREYAEVEAGMREKSREFVQLGSEIYIGQD
jgi:hypothetical protein